MHNCLSEAVLIVGWPAFYNLRHMDVFATFVPVCFSSAGDRELYVSNFSRFRCLRTRGIRLGFRGLVLEGAHIKALSLKVCRLLGLRTRVAPLVRGFAQVLVRVRLVRGLVQGLVRGLSLV